jgi:hypothetical protein
MKAKTARTIAIATPPLTIHDVQKMSSILLLRRLVFGSL